MEGSKGGGVKRGAGGSPGNAASRTSAPWPSTCSLRRAGTRGVCSEAFPVVLESSYLRVSTGGTSHLWGALFAWG